ncbi:hypothetical protein V7159_08545, partial [Priestia megaterium]|uniref:hypothetical protein n=1 Tax=Priestia megaterium TaxID=1404 RepID=UPI0030081BBC
TIRYYVLHRNVFTAFFRQVSREFHKFLFFGFALILSYFDKSYRLFSKYGIISLTFIITKGKQA